MQRKPIKLIFYHYTQERLLLNNIVCNIYKTTKLKMSQMQFCELETIRQLG